MTLFIITTLVTLSFAFCSGLIAQKKNRFVFGWFVLGAMFGPFALLVILCMPEKIVGSNLKKVEAEP